MPGGPVAAPNGDAEAPRDPFPRREEPSLSPPRPSLLERHGRRMARFRWAVIPLFVLLLVLAVPVAGRLGGVTTSETSLPGSEGQRGLELIERHFDHGGETSDLQAVFRNPDLTVDDPAFRAAVEASVARGAAVVPGTRTLSSWSADSRDLASADGHTAVVTLTLPSDDEDAADAVAAIRKALGTLPGFRPTLLGGEAAMGHDLDPIVGDDLARAELLVLPAALLILLIYFGSVVGALVPLLTAAVTIVLAMAGTTLAGERMDIAEQVVNVITLVGVAIGVDYALLVVSRFREELAAGHDRVTAAGRTVATAGRAVLLSGATVAIGLAVLVALPVPFIRSMGVGGMLVPAAAVLAALTVLPALLCALGHRVDALPAYPRRWRRRRTGAGWIARLTTGKAAPLALLLAVGLVALAAQAPGMGIHQDALSDAPDVESVQAGRIIQAELGGAGAPGVFAIDTGRAGGAYAPATLDALSAAADGLRADRSVVAGVTWPRTTDPTAFRSAAEGGLVDATGRYALMSVAPLGDAESASARALNDLMAERADAIEAELPAGADVLITGEPAIMEDFTDAMYGPFPWLVAGVLLLTFVALMRAFRSLALPMIATVASALSLLGTYGLLYLVFQRGVGADLIGVDHEVRGIAFWIPIFVFAFLFGISMDYQVFLAERMRELRDAGNPARLAVRLGLARTGRVVVAAAAIMTVAFAGFATGRDLSLKEFGFSLAAAVAIDALVVRCVIVPAAMSLLGERCWALPRPLARILRVAPRGAIDAPAPAPARGPAVPPRTIEGTQP
ncbi:MAG: trehalose monomycolate/heme transporter [Miltoncostaeaceae bacterium]|nr:trehalose monomycolate/heme transporter [Miltoncostaeaceae bacterium]